MKWITSALLGLWILLHPGPARLLAQEFPDSDLVQRFESIEQRIQSLEEIDVQPDYLTRQAEINQAIETYLDAKQAEAARTRPTISLFGRLQFESLFFPSTTPGINYFENPATGADVADRIQFRRIRIGAQGSILENGVYRIDLDFGTPSSPAIRDTYLGFEDLPFLQTLLIGNQKRPLGLDAWNSNNYQIFMERPSAVTAYNPGIRRVGVQTLGYTRDESLNWQLGIFELPNIQRPGGYLGDPLLVSYNARLSGTPWYDAASGGRGYLHLGISNMYADTNANAAVPNANVNQLRFRTRPELRTSSNWLDTGPIAGSDYYDTLGLEAVLNVGAVQLTGEYLQTWVARPGNSDLSFDGGYLQAAYFLTGEHEPWDRQTGRLGRVRPHQNFFLVNRYCSDKTTSAGLGAWQIATRWSYLNLTDRDIQGGREENLALALNWYWTPFSKMVLNVVHGQINDHAPVAGYTSGEFTGIGVRFMMDY